MALVQIVAVRGGDAARIRLWEIDCLRGLAALAVFLFHVSDAAGFDKRRLPAFEIAGVSIPGLPNLFSFGATGVSLFFVVSGFCLVLQRRRQRPLAGAGTYLRQRFARIVPAYWAAVVLSGLFLVLRGKALLATGWSVLVHLGFLHGMHPAQFLELNGALWSMATEGQFYLLFPALALCQERIPNGWFLLACALWTFAFRVGIASVSWPEVAGHITLHALLAYQLPGRLLEFALGMWMANEYVAGNAGRWWRGFVLAMPLSLAVGLYCRALGPAWSPDLASGVLYANLLGTIVFAPRAVAPGKAGEAGAWFGRVSYSFFLLHVPIVLALAEGMRAVASPIGRFPLLLALGFPLCLGAAVLLHGYVEMPLWERLRGGPIRN